MNKKLNLPRLSITRSVAQQSTVPEKEAATFLFIIICHLLACRGKWQKGQLS
jgi:hypothetical protein